jgi:hypothetical protein
MAENLSSRLIDRALLATIAVLPLAGVVLAACDSAHAGPATLYKNPQCDCCEGYAAYLRQHGYDVKVIASHDLSLIKQDHGVPAALEGCHTTLVSGYVVEGHVPYAHIDRLLAEKPAITGISLPGMPLGSPGMTGTKAGPFTIYAFDKQGQRTYAVD